MASWDRMSSGRLAGVQDRLVREQVRHAVAPFSPYWRRRLAELGRSADSIDTVARLATLPAAGERDVSPAGDPAGMAALVLQAGERGFALHAGGPQLRRALALRLVRPDAYRRVVETDTRPTSYVWAGLGFRFLIASTRGDLDVLARTGARLWRVLGLTGDDALLSALPVAATTQHVGLAYAALAAGAPAMFPGDDTATVAMTSRLAPPTVVAVPAAAAAGAVNALVDAGAAFERVTTLLVVGAPSGAERAAATEAVAAVAPRAGVLAVHAPDGARLLWGECRASAGSTGFHTYPDHEVVQLVDPETAEPAADDGEVVLTQLRMHGSALLRWRTADVALGPIDATPCPGCGRRVPRVTVRRSPLVRTTDDGRTVDLRCVAGALTGRPDIDDWRIVVGDHGDVVVYIATAGDPRGATAAAAADVRALAGVSTELAATGRDGLALVSGERLTRRIMLRR